LRLALDFSVAGPSSIAVQQAVRAATRSGLLEDRRHLGNSPVGHGPSIRRVPRWVGRLAPALPEQGLVLEHGLDLAGHLVPDLGHGQAQAGLLRRARHLVRNALPPVDAADGHSTPRLKKAR